MNKLLTFEQIKISDALNNLLRKIDLERTKYLKLNMCPEYLYLGTEDFALLKIAAKQYGQYSSDCEKYKILGLKILEVNKQNHIGVSCV